MIVFNVSFVAFGQTVIRFCLHAFGFIMYLVLALLKVALVNFTLNEYMMTSNPYT